MEVAQEFQENTLYSPINTKQEEEIYSKLKTRINRIIQNEGYISHSIHKRIISTQGNNYSSILIEVDIKGRTKNGDNETNIFVKYILPENGFESVASMEDFFEKEMLIYRQIAPMFMEIEEEANIPQKDRYRIVKSYDGCDKDAVILENVAKKGFKTLFRMDVAPLKFAETSIVELAKFHAVSFALEINRLDVFDSKIITLKPTINLNKPWQLFVTKMSEVAMQHLDAEERKKVEAFIPTLIEKFPTYISDDNPMVKCLCHGDFRMNNMLTRTNGDEMEILPVDYQGMFYGSPVTDLIYFIFSVSDKQFRKQHMNHLKDLYFTNLDRFLQNFHIDVDHVYPRKNFERDFMASLDYGLMYTLLILPFSFTSQEEIIDFGKSTAMDSPFILDDRFKDRITGIVEDYVEWGIL